MTVTLPAPQNHFIFKDVIYWKLYDIVMIWLAVIGHVFFFELLPPEGDHSLNLIWAKLFCLLLQTFHTTPSPTQTSLIVNKSTFWDSFLKIKKRNGRSLTRSTRWDGSRAFKPISKIRFWCFKGSVLDSGLCEKAFKKLQNVKISKTRLSWYRLGSYRTQVICRT